MPLGTIIEASFDRSFALYRDLIEVIDGHNASIEEMLKIPVGPAPREKAVQVWRSADVLQHLDLRGIRSAGIRWSGNTQASLQRLAAVGGINSDSMQPAFVQQRTIELAAWVTFVLGAIFLGDAVWLLVEWFQNRGGSEINAVDPSAFLAQSGGAAAKFVGAALALGVLACIDRYVFDLPEESA